MNGKRNKSQAFAEYAFLIAVIVGVLIAMRVYFVRGVQQKYRESVDVFGQGEQYAPGRTVVTDLDGSIVSINREIPPRDTCAFVVAEVDRLERKITELDARAAALEESSDDALEQIPILQQEAANLHQEATDFRNLASQKQDEVANLTDIVARSRVMAERKQS